MVSASFCQDSLRYKVLLHPVEWDSFRKLLTESIYLIDNASLLEDNCISGIFSKTAFGSARWDEEMRGNK